MNTKGVGTLSDLFKNSVLSDGFAKLVLSSPKSEIIKVKIKPVVVQGKTKVSFVYSYKTRDITKNYSVESSIGELSTLYPAKFSQANLFTLASNYHFNNNSVKLLPPTKKQIDVKHNRKKTYVISPTREFLKELEIAGPASNIRKRKYDKFEQINKFLRIVDANLSSNNLYSNNQIRVVDAGSGNAYMTFALYDYLANIKNLKVQIVGYDLKQDLVEKANKRASNLGFKHLRFENKAIMQIPNTKIDLLIALHACSGATDEAIYTGIKNKAKLIMVAPCCHKLLRHTMNPPKVYKKHGIILERQAELLTDLLRAELMETVGYRTKIIEFVPLEHTSKNSLIIGRKAEHTKLTSKNVNLEILKSYYGINSIYLEELLISEKQCHAT